MVMAGVEQTPSVRTQTEATIVNVFLDLRFKDQAVSVSTCNTPVLPYFGVFPLYQIVDIGVSPNINLKLFARKKYFRSIPTYVITVPKRHRHCLSDRRTDRQTDDLLWHNRVSHGKTKTSNPLCLYPQCCQKWCKFVIRT